MRLGKDVFNVELDGSYTSIENSCTPKHKIIKENQMLGQILAKITCLSRYGIVTEYVLFKTDKVEVKNDGESGGVGGKILVGEFKGSLLSEIDIDNLKYLSSHYDTDADTSKSLELYINYSEENQQCEDLALCLGNPLYLKV